MTSPELLLTEAMLAGNRPLASGDPPPLPAKAPYLARELRIVTVSTGGFALVNGPTILGVAEAEGRLLSLVSKWAQGG